MGFELCHPAVNQLYPYFFNADYMDNGFTYPRIRINAEQRESPQRQKIIFDLSV